MKTYTTNYASPVGTLSITATASHVIEILFGEQPASIDSDFPDVLQRCTRQIDDYFQGVLTAFSVDLNPRGTEFQQRVWRQLEEIPYAETVSYGDVARSIGKPTACRAVGGANGRNPIPIIIPCHRVIGSSGQLTGYGSGIWRKEWLLEHEKMVAASAF
jgi:methylated-DNA-[protein]-cysteine S-methyltransferase